MTDLLGQTLSDRYYITSLIGKGGIADVYRAHDQSRNVDLAIKVLKPDLAADRVFVEHFREEAKTLRDLEHPNIVRFYSFERDDDTFFIVMDYVEGITLREEINICQGPLAPERILETMRGVPFQIVHYYAPWQAVSGDDSLLQLIAFQSRTADLAIVFTWQAHANHLLYAEDWQGKIIGAIQQNNIPLIVGSLKSPTNILEFPSIRTYLASFGTTNGQVQALVDILVGKSPAYGVNPLPQLP